MEQLARNPGKRRGLQAIVLFLTAALVIVLFAGFVIYLLNRENQLPDAAPSTLEPLEKP